MSKLSTTPSLFSASVPPAVIEEVLQRIHENVYLHPLIAEQLKPGGQLHDQFDYLPPLPTPPNFSETINEIRSAQAPFYVVSGNFLARLIKRAHNQVLKLFGRKQAYFNNLTLNLLESMAAYLHALQEHDKAQSSRIESLTSQVLLQAEQLTALRMEYQKMLLEIEQIAAQRHPQDQELENRGEPPTSYQNGKQ